MAINLDPANCGTPGNAQAHYRRGEKPCEACRLAHNRDVSDRRLKDRVK